MFVRVRKNGAVHAVVTHPFDPGVVATACNPNWFHGKHSEARPYGVEVTVNIPLGAKRCAHVACKKEMS